MTYKWVLAVAIAMGLWVSAIAIAYTVEDQRSQNRDQIVYLNSVNSCARGKVLREQIRQVFVYLKVHDVVDSVPDVKVYNCRKVVIKPHG